MYQVRYRHQYKHYYKWFTDFAWKHFLTAKIASASYTICESNVACSVVKELNGTVYEVDPNSRTCTCGLF